MPISTATIGRPRRRPANYFTKGVAGRVMALGLSLGLVLSGCGLPADPTLRQPGDADPDASFGVTVADVAAGESHTFGAIALCVDSDEPVTVTAVSFEDLTNLEVVDFAVSQSSEFGGDQVTLAQAGFDATQRDVSAPCPNAANFLGVELRRGPQPVTGSGRPLVVTYADGNRERRTTVPFYAILCAPTDVEGDCNPEL